MLVSEIIKKVDLRVPVKPRQIKYYENRNYPKGRIFADLGKNGGITYRKDLEVNEYFDVTQQYSINIKLIEDFLKKEKVINSDITPEIFIIFILFHEEGHLIFERNKATLSQVESDKHDKIKSMQQEIVAKNNDNSIKLVNKVKELIKTQNNIQYSTEDIKKFANQIFLHAAQMNTNKVKESINILEEKFNEFLGSKGPISYLDISYDINTLVQNLHNAHKSLQEAYDKLHRSCPKEIYADNYAALRLNEYINM